MSRAPVSVAADRASPRAPHSAAWTPSSAHWGVRSERSLRRIQRTLTARLVRSARDVPQPEIPSVELVLGKLGLSSVWIRGRDSAIDVLAARVGMTPRTLEEELERHCGNPGVAERVPTAHGPDIALLALFADCRNLTVVSPATNAGVSGKFAVVVHPGFQLSSVPLESLGEVPGASAAPVFIAARDGHFEHVQPTSPRRPGSAERREEVAYDDLPHCDPRAPDGDRYFEI